MRCRGLDVRNRSTRPLARTMGALKGIHMSELPVLADFDSSNFDEFPCCGIRNPADEGRRQKLCWIRKNLAKGLRARTLVAQGKPCGYIEYLPVRGQVRGRDCPRGSRGLRVEASHRRTQIAPRGTKCPDSVRGFRSDPEWPAAGRPSDQPHAIPEHHEEADRFVGRPL